VKPTRRSLIIGAGFGVAAPSLVQAKDLSLIDVPGDPLTARGLFAAAKWASDEFQEMPGCRLVFSDGHKHNWFTYNLVSRQSPTKDDPSRRAHAVAIEVVVTDANGKRFVTSVPIDAAAYERRANARVEEWSAKHRWAEEEWF
jgi:hypothetical protein